MPTISGKYGAIVIGASAVGILKDWERTIEESDIDLSAQGDDWEDSTHLRNRWMVRSGYDFANEDYGSYGNLVGVDAAVVLKVDATIETGGTSYFTGSGRITRDTNRLNVEDRVTGEVEIKGKGAPTFIL